jgi:hypothetical protein
MFAGIPFVLIMAKFGTSPFSTSLYLAQFGPLKVRGEGREKKGSKIDLDRISSCFWPRTDCPAALLGAASLTRLSAAMEIRVSFETSFD